MRPRASTVACGRSDVIEDASKSPSPPVHGQLAARCVSEERAKGPKIKCSITGDRQGCLLLHGQRMVVVSCRG